MRAIRSAASHFWTWDLLASRPEELALGCKERLTVADGCSPTDEAHFACFADGMRRRIGDNPEPSAVLLIHHILWINERLEERFQLGTATDERIEICRAAVAHGTACAGWLRGVETFSIRWENVTICLPVEGPMVGLPMGIGVLLLQLLKQTKSHQHKRVDAVLAFVLASGLQLGRWCLRLWRLLPEDERAPHCFVMAHRDGRAWTSHHFRHTCLHPFLHVLHALDDPHISKHSLEEIKTAFHSFHACKRSGRSVASRVRPQTMRPAAPAEVIEHGRWRLSRTSLDMPLACLDWSIEDRICVAQFCMQRSDLVSHRDAWGDRRQGPCLGMVIVRGLAELVICGAN